MNLVKNQSSKHLYWLDLIRFFAAFSVMACHFRGAFFEEYSNLPLEEHNSIIFAFYFITRLGFEAVLVFFVLSGFLVGGKAIKRICDGSFKAKDYAIDRFARIMLPLVASLLFYLPICLYFDIPINIADWVGSLCSVQGILTKSAFATLWSLSYEVWFYILIFSIGLIWINNGKHNKILLGLALLLIGMLVFVKLKGSYLYVWLFAAIVFAKLKCEDTRRHRITAAFMLFISAVIIVLLQISSGSRYFQAAVASNVNLFRDILIVLFGLSFSVFVRIIIEIVPHRKWVININKIGTKLAAFFLYSISNTCACASST